MKPTLQRKGIALFTAIAFLLIVATIMAIMLSMTALTTKRGVDIFFEEQAHLLAKSATEHALLAISGHEHNVTTQCINSINSNYLVDGGGNAVYQIQTNIRYFGLDAYGGTCAGNNSITDGGLPIYTPESNGTIIIDVNVTVPTLQTQAEPVRFHRRTMQKP